MKTARVVVWQIGLMLVAAIVLLPWAACSAAAAQPGEEKSPRIEISGPKSPVTTNAVPEEPKVKQAGGAAGQNQENASKKSVEEIAFSCAVLLFGLILVGVEAWLTKLHKLSENSAFKLIGLTIVITAGLFALPAGYSQNQMTPLMGLLGAIAGYLLGKEGAKETQNSQGAEGAPKPKPAPLPAPQ